MNSTNAAAAHPGSRPFRLAARNDEVREAVAAVIHRDPQLRNKSIGCDYSEGVLTLRGRLPSYYLKQLAQTYVRRIDGVQAIVNGIEVVAHPHSPR